MNSNLPRRSVRRDTLGEKSASSRRSWPRITSRWEAAPTDASSSWPTPSEKSILVYGGVPIEYWRGQGTQETIAGLGRAASPESSAPCGRHDAAGGHVVAAHAVHVADRSEQALQNRPQGPGRRRDGARPLANDGGPPCCRAVRASRGKAWWAI